MTISYNWLSDYLPIKVDPERLSTILTSIGLEVEKMETFQEVKGGLIGLVIGEVLTTEKHPNADKLTLTKVDVGMPEPLQIVCGASNVAAGQKVIVAPVSSTIYPINGNPMSMKPVKIRGVESQGMICAEDEIGLGESHAGIMILPDDATPGGRVADYFKTYTDIIYEIGLTPNRMDAMSHWGVARDVCANLSHHDQRDYKPNFRTQEFTIDNESMPISVKIENKEACKRYSGVSIANVTLKESPRWLQQRLKSIGVRPVNNIVDITNYIQHETGQPLHAFDYNAIKGKKTIVKNADEGSLFKTLDDKERKLKNEDLMICNEEAAMCIAGVFGGIESGVSNNTKHIFLESAYFDPATIRKTSFRYGLRTNAATRFEKGIDISATVKVLEHAALLIKEIAGGEIASTIIDVYPNPQPKTEVTLKYQYLLKLSGKRYEAESIKNILQHLGFIIKAESTDELLLKVPYHKPDISLPADVVEEILRIDGLDNIEIPTAITITPSVEENYKEETIKEKIANLLTGCGFAEILTNSITSSKYFTTDQLENAVRLMNNLSNELDVMRLAMLPTALEVISFNINRKNNHLLFFEFGKTYRKEGVENYIETNHLCLYLTGNIIEQHWKSKSEPSDIYFLKGIAEAVFKNLGIQVASEAVNSGNYFETMLKGSVGNDSIVKLGKVSANVASPFDIKQPVFFADFNWDIILKHALHKKIKFSEIPKFPPVERDISTVVTKSMHYEEIKNIIDKLGLSTLQNIKLFDVFESEKLGKDKKSMAINFTFLDKEKTLTDKEIDAWMNKIMTTLEKELGAEIRK